MNINTIDAAEAASICCKRFCGITTGDNSADVCMIVVASL
jgi:hypothetical protein